MYTYDRHCLYLSPDSLHLPINTSGGGDKLISEKLERGQTRDPVRKLNKAAIRHQLLDNTRLDHPYL